MVSPKYPHSNFRNLRMIPYMVGEILANVIKNLEMERLSWIMQVVANVITSVLISGTDGDLTHRGQGNAKTDQRYLAMLALKMEMMQPQAKGATRSRKRQGMDSPLEPLEGVQLCEHLDFGQ